jgi:ABC-type dipeptide/oligopeptide/nickel transport system permease subunit
VAGFAETLPAEVEPELRPAYSPWSIAIRRLLTKKIALCALAIILVFYFVGFFAPVLAPYDFLDQDLDNPFGSPSLDHPFGTDRLGRDLFSRVIWSARTTIIVTIATIFTGGLVLAVGLGLLSGYAGGKTDTVIMRTGEIFASLPGLPMLILINATMRDRVRNGVDWLEGHLSTGEPAFLVLLALFSLLIAVGIAGRLIRGEGRGGAWLALAFIGAGAMLALWGIQGIFATDGAADYFLIFGALSLFVWVGGARVIRAQVLALRETEYVLAARAMGAGTWRILTTHLLPNVSPIIIVSVSASLGAIVGSEIALTFLGVGIHEPTPSFGALITDSAGSVSAIRQAGDHPHTLLAPAIVIATLIFAFNLLGDALNDVFTPKAR